MSEEHDLWLVGLGASPYTRKLRAVLRYRRIPYRFVVVDSEEANALPERPLPLVPYLVLPDANGAPLEPLSDTTPIIRRLEQLYDERPLRPSDPGLRLIDSLIEDYGDEWLSKCMFHYRWSNAPDTQKASSYLPYGRNMQMTPEQAKQASRTFADRQISRIGVVGSNETTAPVIESSWRRYLQIFDSHLQHQPYLLGRRPGAGDFACYGQMTMLVITDPTPAGIALEISPRAYAWTERLEDVSGIEVSGADWVDLDNPPPTLRDLLCEIGRFHVPFLLANAAAIEAGTDRVECEIDDRPWVQEPFPYQAKCLRWLRDEYQSIDGTAKSQVNRILEGTGCEALFGN